MSDNWEVVNGKPISVEQLRLWQTMPETKAIFALLADLVESNYAKLALPSIPEQELHFYRGTAAGLKQLSGIAEFAINKIGAKQALKKENNDV